MSGIISKLREENELVKELLEFNGSETHIQHLKDIFTKFIKISKIGSNYFINFLNHYSICRLHHHVVSGELVECVYSSFPEQIDEIKQYIKNTKILKFIIFPEEFPINKSEERKEMFLFLQEDDIDGFISFLSKNPTIDITKDQKLE